MLMIQLNYRDSKPIYEQIKDGLKRLIITGAIAPDEKMPSVRELASQLAINPNTIAKAIRELEQEVLYLHHYRSWQFCSRPQRHFSWEE